MTGIGNRSWLTGSFLVVRKIRSLRNAITFLCSIFSVFTITQVVYPGPVVRIPARSPAEVETIVRAQGDVLCGSNRDSLLVEFPSLNEYHNFLQDWQGGPTHLIATDPSQLLGRISPTADETDEYHNYATAAAIVLSFAQRHPTIAKVDTFGRSRQNRPLLHLKISDSVNIDRDVPRIYVLSGTHGNELIGVEVTLCYLQWLDTVISTDTAMLRRIRQTELHIFPMHNPDGYNAHMRENANYVDLNRNFSFHWGWQATSQGPSPLSEPEDSKLDSILSIIQPCVSVSYHSFGGQILRPYSWYSREPPDSAIMRAVSAVYHPFVPSYVQELGGQLYWHGGEHNDHNYAVRGNPGLTAEVWQGGDYNPPVDSIWRVCLPHRYAINAIIDRAVKNQITGIIRDSISLAPIANARWTSVSNWDSGFVARRVLSNGRYRMLREPGPVTLRFSAPGYQSRNISVTITNTNSPTVADVILQSSHCGLRGNVSIVNRRMSDSIFANIQYQSVPIDSAGNFFFGQLSAQLDTVIISGYNYEPLRLPVALASMETTTVRGWTLRMLPPIVTRAFTTQGQAELFWRSPYTDSLARSRIRGYAVWRDGMVYIPLTYDSSFAEPFPGTEPRRLYRLQTLYLNGASILGDSILLTPQDKVRDVTLPQKYGIGRAYPNPFNSTVSIPYRLLFNQRATLTVYDCMGRVIITKVIPNGSSGIWHWSPGHERFAGGLYFLRIQTNGKVENRKLVYLP